MSPTVFIEKGFRFLFFSREEPRIHVHVQCPQGEAKFWLEPRLELARSQGLSEREIRIIENIIKSIPMKSQALGIDTSLPEVTNISRHGIWLLTAEEELFLSFDEFPWFKEARVSAILHVECPQPGHFYWPDMDVDLALESIRHPERYPFGIKSKKVNRPTIQYNQSGDTNKRTKGIDLFSNKTNDTAYPGT